MLRSDCFFMYKVFFYDIAFLRFQGRVFWNAHCHYLRHE